MSEPQATAHETPASNASAHLALGAGREFDLIRRLLERWGDAATGIGDDAAVVDIPAMQKLVISTDAVVEHVHFERAWISPGEVGARATAAALSDIAAMGAMAAGVLVAFVVPAHWLEDIEAVADGIAKVTRASGARIIGGNVSAGEQFSCTLTVLGWTAAPVSRRGARAGDVLMVTGILGGPGAAVRAWQAGTAPAEWARARFVAPEARLSQGAWLAAQGIHAMIDISDGLAADARHLAAASALDVTLEPERIPRFPTVSSLDALASGEEYELLVAVDADAADDLSKRFEAHFHLPLTVVGTFFTPTQHTKAASRVEFPVGHDHLSR